MCTPSFWDVKAILDWLALGRTMQQLTAVHGTSFGWSNRRALLDAVVQLDPTNFRTDESYRLIQPELVGVGRGDETNLVRAIRDDEGVGGWKKMPKNGNADGKYATPLQIETIIAWIDAGCPE